MFNLFGTYAEAERCSQAPRPAALRRESGNFWLYLGPGAIFLCPTSPPLKSTCGSAALITPP